MTEEILSLEELFVTFYGDHASSHAVRGVDFSLYKGEVLGVVGESGCGKSATVRAILQLLPQDNTKITGKVLYGGQNLLELKDKQMQKIRGRKISMIFQDPMTSLNPTMQIGAQILEGYLQHFPQVSRKKAKDHVISLLEMVGISDPEKRFYAYPHTLSGGMRQRVMIALSLICHPDILLADEATTALDVTIQAQILHLMHNLQQKMGMSILLITHDLSVAAQFCDRILVMYAGKIVEEALTSSLFERPKHPYTKLLLKALPKLHQSRKEPLIPIQGAPPLLTDIPTGCPFAPGCPYTKPRCLEKEPTLLPTDVPKHKSACFLSESL